MEEVIRKCIGEWRTGELATLTDMKNKMISIVSESEESQQIVFNIIDSITNALFVDFLAMGPAGISIIFHLLGFPPVPGPIDPGAVRRKCKEALIDCNIPSRIRQIMPTESQIDKIMESVITTGKGKDMECQ